MIVWLFSTLGTAKKALKAAFDFVLKYPLQAAVVILLLFCAWLWRANSHLRDGIKAERAAHAQTVANFRKAQADAEALQQHNLTRVSKAQEDITHETVTDYRARLADLRARYGRLRAQGNRSAPGNAGLPAVPDAAGGIDEAPAENGLLAADALIASEQALQLDALINWVEGQSKVDTSPENQK